MTRAAHVTLFANSTIDSIKRKLRGIVSMRVLRSLVTICLLFVSGCVTNQGLWIKPGVGLDEFNKDKYACLQQSQQPTSSLYVNRYGGFGNSAVITNGGLYGACMNAHGWYLTPVSDPQAYNNELASAMAPAVNACTSAEYQVLFPRKMSCKAVETNQEQLMDRSKISASEKEAIEKWIALVSNTNSQLEAIQTKYNTKSGAVLASSIEKSTSDLKNLSNDLVARKISWGDFNKGRLNIARRSEESMKYALQN